MNYNAAPIYPNYYALLVVDISPLRNYHRHAFAGLQQKHKLFNDDYENVYDWCINEALLRTHLRDKASGIQGHYKHDIYLCYYEDVRPEFEAHLRHHQALANQQFMNGLAVKTLVAGPNLMIAREGKM